MSALFDGVCGKSQLSSSDVDVGSWSHSYRNLQAGRTVLNLLRSPLQHQSVCYGREPNTRWIRRMLTFNTLWKNHPEIFGDAAPCRTNGAKNFSDQCAINLGVALRRSGADLSKLSGVRYCWQHPKSEGHILAAEEMAKALSRANVPGLQRVQKVKPEDFEDVLAGQQGIIFFKDFWRRGSETFGNRSGDHIDLWNGRRLTDWLSYPRIQLGFSIEGTFSDYHESREIWFWKVL